MRQGTVWPPLASPTATAGGVWPSKRGHGAVRLALALSLLKGSWSKLRGALAELARLVAEEAANCSLFGRLCRQPDTSGILMQPTSCRRVLQAAGWWLAGLRSGRPVWHLRRWHLLLAGLLGAKLLHKVLSAVHSLIFSRAERQEKLRLKQVMRQAATYRWGAAPCGEK